MHRAPWAKISSSTNLPEGPVISLRLISRLISATCFKLNSRANTTPLHPRFQEFPNSGSRSQQGPLLRRHHRQHPARPRIRAANRALLGDARGPRHAVLGRQHRGHEALQRGERRPIRLGPWRWVLFGWCAFVGLLAVAMPTAVKVVPQPMQACAKAISTTLR